MKAFWRRGGDGLFHLYLRGDGHSIFHIKFSTLCMKEWMSTIQYDRPKPYPPTESLCQDCLANIPKGCKT